MADSINLSDDDVIFRLDTNMFAEMLRLSTANLFDVVNAGGTISPEIGTERLHSFDELGWSSCYFI